MTDAFIDLRDITKDFGGVHALRGVNMQIPKGKSLRSLGTTAQGSPR